MHHLIASRTTGSLLLLLATGILADNPVISHRQLADPNAFVYKDRIYAICSNDDDNGNGYDMKSAVMISTGDLKNWTDHGDVFRTTRDAKWAAGSYAPTATVVGGKVYLYFPNIASGVGVLVADKPEGPYKDPLGRALVSGSTMCDMAWCFDPVVFVDDNGAGYLVWGGGTPFGNNFRGVALNADMISLKGSSVKISVPNSFEGPFVHKYKGTYYLHYPVNPSSNIEYSTSTTSPISGYARKGVLLPNPTLNGQNINGNNNSHESVFEYKGNWYMMYHDRRLASSSTYKRDVSIDKVEYNADGTMKQVVVTAGMSQLANFDPYDSIPAATMSKQSGIKASYDPASGFNYLVPQSSGSWIRISAVDFQTGAKALRVHAGSNTANAKVEVRTGSENGTLAGTCDVSNTGSPTKLSTTECTLTGLSGVKDLFLKFTGTTANTNLAWFRFVPQSTSILRPRQAETPTAPSRVDYEVFDLRGQRAGSFSTASGVSGEEAWALHGTSLRAGSYLVRIRDASGIRVRKFVNAAPAD